MEALKILIIEDDLLLAEELQEQLLDFGYAITDTVANSRDAMKAFRRRLPDLVLCDIQLQGSELDGIQLSGKLREMAPFPLVFLTAFGDVKTVERAKAVCPDYYLIKPCNPNQLQVAIDLALSNFANQQEPDPKHSLQFHSSPPCAFYSTQHFFFVKDGYKYVRVEIADIVFIEAMGANVKIVTDQFSVVLTANLASFSNQVISKALVRVHRSYMINFNKVHSFDAGRVFIPYKGELKEIPVGKTYRDGFQNQMPRLKSD